MTSINLKEVIGVDAPCNSCIHYITWETRDKKTCSAFPEGIPDIIWFGKNPHTKPYPGDKGIRFEKYR